MKTVQILVLASLISINLNALFAAVPFPDSGDQNGNKCISVTRAAMYNGEWIPFVQLPEIVISGMRPVLAGAVMRNHEIVILAELPLVEVTASPLKADESKILSQQPVYQVQLPEVQITATFPKDKLHQGIRQGNDVMAVVFLPDVTIYGFVDGTDHVNPAVLYGAINTSLKSENNMAAVQSEAAKLILSPLSRLVIIKGNALLLTKVSATFH